MTNETKIAIIAGIFALIGSIGGTFLGSFLKINELKDQNKFNSQKTAIEKIFLNSLEVEEICNNIETYENIKDLDIKKLKKIHDTNFQTKILVDIYFHNHSSKFKDVQKKEYHIYKAILVNHKKLKKDEELKQKDKEEVKQIIKKYQENKIKFKDNIKINFENIYKEISLNFFEINKDELFKTQVIIDLTMSCEEYNKESIKFRKELKNEFMGI